MERQRCTSVAHEHDQSDSAQKILNQPASKSIQ
jgi:hypothetical protein